MKKILPILALVGLALTIFPSVAYLFGAIPLKMTFILMTVGMVIWFGAATPWLGRRELRPSDSEVQI